VLKAEKVQESVPKFKEVFNSMLLIADSSFLMVFLTAFLKTFFDSFFDDFFDSFMGFFEDFFHLFTAFRQLCFVYAVQSLSHTLQKSNYIF
jgi:hypothetical protein